MMARGRFITFGDFFNSHFIVQQRPTRHFPPFQTQIPFPHSSSNLIWTPNKAGAACSSALSLPQRPFIKAIDLQKQRPQTSSYGKKSPIVDSEDFPLLPSRSDPGSLAAKGFALPAPPLTTPSQAPPTKSFREAVSAQWAHSIDVSLPPVPTPSISTFMGEPAVIISEEEEVKLAKNFQHALIGTFNQGRPSMASIRKATSATGLKGECHIGLIDYRHVIFQFQLQEDFHRFWLKKAWNFEGFTAKLFRWTPDFSPNKEPSIAPVWVNFPHLPLHFCKKEMLYTIGSIVGIPLKLDLATAAMERVLRPSEARICIEVDLLKPLPNRVWIGTEGKGKWQSIQYENLPVFCTKCSMLDHTTASCKTKVSAPLTKVWVPKKPSANTEKNFNAGATNSRPSSAGEDRGKKVLNCPPGSNVLPENKERTEIQSKNLEQDNKSLAMVVHSAQNNMGQRELESNNLRPFIICLGQLLDFINKEKKNLEDVEVSGIQPLGEGYSTAGSKGHISPEDEKTKELISGGINVSINWEEGESSNQGNGSYMTEVGPMTELEIIQGIQEIRWDEEELARLFPLSMPSKVNRKKDSNASIKRGKGEPPPLHRVNSTLDAAILQAIPIEEEEEDDGEDQWTEHSYEGEAEDVFNSFLEKMENTRKTIKKTKYMEALLSPKASDCSGRKLRDRNPRVCYSEGKNWHLR